MWGDKDSCMGDEAAFEVVSVYADEGVVLKTMTVTSWPVKIRKFIKAKHVAALNKTSLIKIYRV